jgi:hypothetical protein
MLEAVQRPDAPYDLTDEQSAEWWAIVNRMPADWFPRETHPLLSQLCRLIVRARRIAQLQTDMESNPEFDAREYRALIQAECQISREMSSLCTRMRISQQSTYDPSKKKGPALLTRTPWDRKREVAS